MNTFKGFFSKSRVQKSFTWYLLQFPRNGLVWVCVCVFVCVCVCVCVNRSLGAGSLDTELWSTLFWAHGLKPTRAFCPWDFPGKNTGVGYHLFLHGLFPTQGSNSSHLLHRWILYHWATWAAPIGLLHTPNKDTKNEGFALWMQVNTSHNQIKVLLCFVHFKWFFFFYQLLIFF